MSLQENRKYAKYKNMNCNEIYDSDKDDGGDKLPINAEGTNSSDSPIAYRAYLSMNISRNHSGDKRESKHGKNKGKRKK
ncbi:Hypothetical predicted protein [Olea europaea subsp. europaea]|uniref:Uncharacterized protein n=1 Tax=Olea europaea subsp. europaea TaxID=158383 RepID=A0A8S0SQA8_OLEEU|nr:Hypothetical predicted protein [Olea europaea subsp. europaea]